LKWTSICRYTILELLFVTEFHACTYQCTLHPFFSQYISLFHF
jgi:hypothetical protein